MLLNACHGTSSIAGFTRSRLCVLYSRSRGSLSLCRPLSKAYSLSNSPPIPSKPTSKPAQHGFLELFKNSLHSYEPGDEPISSASGPAIKTFYGFIGKRKDLSSSLSFAKLILPRRDHTWIQMVAKEATKQENSEASGTIEKFRQVRAWSAVRVNGTLKHKVQRKEQEQTSRHPQEYEIFVTDIECLAEFPADIVVNKEDSFGLNQRHLQLKFDQGLQKRLAFREFVVRTLRKIAVESGPNDLREIETPILFKSTPEGAKEFLVPTRNPGYAYALPQSPQQYKQLLMASGFSGYFQFAKCFRDEDLRVDRQPEFTQFDLELPFHDGAQIRARIESIISLLWTAAGAKTNFDFTQEAPNLPLNCIGYTEAMSKYGTDKPDLRIPGTIHQVTTIIPKESIGMLTSIPNPEIDAFRFHLNGDAQTTRTFIRNFMNSPDGIPFQRNPEGAPGVCIYDPRQPLEGLQVFGHEGSAALKSRFALKDVAEPLAVGDLIIIQARPGTNFSGGSTSTGRLRTAIYRAALSANLVDPDSSHRFLWVIDFPLFTPDNDVDPGQGGSAGFSATHHPFTSPKRPEDVDYLLTDPLAAKADHYDLVVNGVELGGGSRRIHNSEMQQFVMRDILKMDEERLKNFEHLFEALRSGCPPHAGFALGLDRLVAVMMGVESVRDVIVFPKNGKGEDLLVKSPGVMTNEQLKTYHLEKAD